MIIICRKHSFQAFLNLFSTRLREKEEKPVTAAVKPFFSIFFDPTRNLPPHPCEAGALQAHFLGRLPLVETLEAFQGVVFEAFINRSYREVTILNS